MDVYKTHGAVCWAELSTSNPRAATEFYGRLFGWSFETRQLGLGPYHVVKLGGTPVAGVMGVPPDGPPMPTWGVYITVESIDDTVKQCQELGGWLCAGPFEVPGVGRMAVLQDPQGALFNAITYQPGVGG
jgi:uncharacterized protein